MMTSAKRKSIVASLIDEGQFSTLAEVLRESQRRRQAEISGFPTEAETALRSLLFYVTRHFEFLEKFGADGVPQDDESGTFYNRYDEFVSVWLQLDACGLSESELRRFD
jgi:hypothetical protein